MQLFKISAYSKLAIIWGAVHWLYIALTLGQYIRQCTAPHIITITYDIYMIWGAAEVGQCLLFYSSFGSDDTATPKLLHLYESPSSKTTMFF